MTLLLKQIRIGATVAGLAAALVLTGCSGDSDSGDGDGADSGKDKGADSAASASADTSKTPATGGDTGSKGADLEGSWLATTDGKTVALVINGKEAGLFDSGGSVCTGSAGDKSGTQRIELTCSDGNDDRGMGTVDSVDAKTLKVTWEGSGDETFRKSKGGKLPEGLPTDGVPKS